jgi:hypothetical protein
MLEKLSLSTWGAFQGTVIPVLVNAVELKYLAWLMMQIPITFSVAS